MTSGDFYILCHPDNFQLLAGKLYTNKWGWSDKPSGFVPSRLDGIEIVQSVGCPKWVKKWEFPDTPFVTYEEKDRKWAEPIGFGRLVDSNEPCFMKVAKQPSWIKPYNLFIGALPQENRRYEWIFRPNHHRRP